MSQPLRLLIVEDSDEEVNLLLRVLRQGDYEPAYEVVSTPAAMRAALARQDWDVITSNHAMPHFSTRAALALAQALRPDVPFIIVSGEMSLHLAVSLMQGGAQDYISKRELARLVPVIARELRDVEGRRARQQVEAALQVSETRYRRLFEAARDGILIVDIVTRKITDANPFMVELLGYARDEFLGKELWEIGVLTDAAASQDAFRVLQETGYIRYEHLPLQTKAGARRDVEFVSNVYLENGHQVIQCNIRDITARLQAEAQGLRQREALFQSEKLATMGQLLAGVAHELNNPLSVVMGQAALLQHAMRDTRQAEQAAKIVQAAERCARIVQNFLALARQQPPQRHAVDVNQVVREVVELLAYPLRIDNVDVRFALAPDLPVVWGDVHQLYQVVVNLVTNAHQAMREVAGPRHLTLATGVDAEGQQVWLEVGDSGPGVPGAVQEHIFEPFVTTKPPGMGTGLGLSLCQEIVEEHGGTIRLGQAEPQGAVFRVTLPVAAPHGAALAETPPVGVPTIRGKRVLVVDDEPGIAGVLAEVLALDGHVVDTVAHGGAALAKVLVQPYDLILSDIRMPDVDGPSFYRELARRDPQLLPRLIFMTGDTLSASTQAFLEQTRVPCVRKPFTLAEIRAIVQRTLQALEKAPAGDERLAAQTMTGSLHERHTRHLDA
jgi:PAS domain S-box-containing protein